MSVPCTVTLRHDLPDTERELLRRYCHELHGSDGATLLQLHCLRVDSSDAHYLWLEADLPRRQGLRRLRLPHACVLLIEEQADTATGTAAPAGATPRLP